MPKDKTVRVNTGDWNDLLKASAKKEPAFILVKIKDLKPLPAVVAKAQNGVAFDKNGLPKGLKTSKSTWLAVENVQEYMKEPKPEELNLAYASTFEEAKEWAKKLNG